MRKKFLATMLGAMMMTGAVCSATISTNQLEIGGIKCGATISDVEKVFGQPLKIEREIKRGVEKIEYEYRDFEIKFINGRVQEFEVDYNGNLKTAAGIGVGSTVADVERAYGRPDSIHKDRYKDDFQDKYIYYVDGTNLKLVFEIKGDRVHEFKFDDLD